MDFINFQNAMHLKLSIIILMQFNSLLPQNSLFSNLEWVSYLVVISIIILFYYIEFLSDDILSELRKIQNNIDELMFVFLSNALYSFVNVYTWTYLCTVTASTTTSFDFWYSFSFWSLKINYLKNIYYKYL